MNQFYNVFSALHKLETFYFVKIFLKLSDLQKKKKMKISPSNLSYLK